MQTKEIHIKDYNYPLPDERIAKFPLSERDSSKLLVYKSGEVMEDTFRSLPQYLPKGALMVFNNTKVIRARLHFRKLSTQQGVQGALIEVFLLEPASPIEYQENFIATSNLEWNNYLEPIKIYDFNGNKIKDINDCKDKAMSIKSFFDKKLNKNYILTSNENYLKSYDYLNNKIYHKYYDCENGTHNSFIIKDNEDIIKLIESCNDGNIRIWNFHSGLLINRYKIINKPLIDICLWNNSYLFVGCKDNSIKLIDLKTGLIIKTLTGHNQTVLTIQKIKHLKYGECLISQG